MTVYFRSTDLVITEKLIKVRVPRGWLVWVIGDLSDFGMVPSESPSERRTWGLGWSALVVVVLGIQLRGWLLLLVVPVLALAGIWVAVDRQRSRRRSTSQLWARRDGASVLVFELPNRDFFAACRALRRALERQEDEGNER